MFLSGINRRVKRGRQINIHLYEISTEIYISDSSEVSPSHSLVWERTSVCSLYHVPSPETLIWGYND